jgi:acyl-CoA thioester hydrolase
MTEESTDVRQNYLYWLPIPTRWQDGDPYGHVNNVVYYSFFDTVVTRMLIEYQVLRGPHWRAIGLCIESHCEFHAPIEFPESIDAGLRVGRIGTSSVRYEIALFRGHDSKVFARGYFVHVFVDPDTLRPQPLVSVVRERLSALLVDRGDGRP